MNTLTSTVSGNQAMNIQAPVLSAFSKFRRSAFIARRSPVAAFALQKERCQGFIVPLMDEQTQHALYSMLSEEFGLSDREIGMYLAPAIANLSRRIGLQATLHFLQRYHGRQIYIPESVEGGSGLVEAIGKEAAEGVIAVLGGSQKFDICSPFGQRFQSRMRAVKALRAGMSLNDVAEKIGVSRSTVKKWKQDAGLTGVIKAERKPRHIKRAQATRRPLDAVRDVNAHMLRMRNVRSARLSEQRDRAFQMFETGRRLVDIQAALGLSSTTIKKWRKQYGERT